ncbi:hypothetical protein DPMN_045812 [Dreissena polymorpha]|uniref:Uncharacterized protein n=1 Tax=Dreissena polymorpha TaxID=45954 RepID=A0A9D4HXP2_DREPO|nr:hypothetical protein DPMN_045812 [Dreissena polymorpha]
MSRPADDSTSASDGVSKLDHAGGSTVDVNSQTGDSEEGAGVNKAELCQLLTTEVSQFQRFPRSPRQTR